MKKLVITLLVLVSLVVGAVFALPYLLSSETMRQAFAEKVSAVSGMDIALDGPVSFSVYPDIGLVANNVKLASSAGEYSVSVVKIVAGVRLLSLLSGKIEITALSLVQPEITIVAKDEGGAGGEGVKAAESDGDTVLDPFAAAVEQLERLSLKNFSITDGKFISRAVDGNASIISNINVELNTPGLDEPIKLELNATKDGQNISLTATLAGLRALLQRQPSRFDLALKLDPAPHPALGDLSASGAILLAADGSYQISKGLFTSLGQPLGLDVLYRPGKRPYGSLTLTAKQVDLGVVQKAVPGKAAPGYSAQSKATPAKKQQETTAAIVDVTPLAGFDADISVEIGSFKMDNIEVRDVDLNVRLKDGALDINLGNAGIASGAVAATLTSNLNQADPVVQGSFFAAELGIGDLAQLAHVDVPLKGRLGLNIGYAFRGLSERMIKDSFNFAGTVSLSNGLLTVPAPAGLGPSAKTISGLNLEASIQHAQKPIDLKGKMVWNGEAITFGTLVTPQNFIKNNAGPLTLSVSSGKFATDFTGNIDLKGAVKGQIKFSTGSLGDLMAWVGQEKNAALKGFSYASNISVDAKRFAFDKARISLNGIKARGSGLVGLTGKPSITTNLSFGALDIAALTGGDAKASAKSNGTGGGSKDAPFDLSALRGFDADIKLQAESIQYGKVTTGPVKTTFVVKGGVARINLPGTSFYGGSVLADITADGSGSMAAIKADVKLSNIKAMPLFSDAAGFKRIEGMLNAGVEIEGAGKTTKQFARSLQGNSSAKFTDGAIIGIDIAKIYNNLAAILAGGFKENQSEKTSFTELGLSFVIDKGVATTRDIKLLGPLVRMDGAGSIDLGEETIDMRLNPLVVVSATGQGGEFDLGGVGIPVLIKGPLSKPQIYPDLKELLKNPQAALKSLSKLGLDLKGFGDGKIDLAKLAADKLGLNKPGGTGAKRQVAKVLKNLVSGNGKGNGKTSGTDKLISGVLGQLLAPDAPKKEKTTGNQPANNTRQPDGSIDLGKSTGRVAIPTPSPRRQAAIADKPKTAPKTAKAKTVNRAPPRLKLTVDESINKKTINNLLDNVFR